MSKNFQVSPRSTTLLLKKRKDKKKEKKRKKDEGLPPGVRRVVSEKQGMILSWEKYGNRYKVKVKYHLGIIRFETYIVLPDGKCIECRRTQSYALVLAKKRRAKLRYKTDDSDD